LLFHTYLSCRANIIGAQLASQPGFPTILRNVARDITSDTKFCPNRVKNKLFLFANKTVEMYYGHKKLLDHWF
jgi:hypothetical protein